jgi:hypothetical protein
LKARQTPIRTGPLHNFCLAGSGDEVIYNGGAEVDGFEPYKLVPEKYRGDPAPEGSEQSMREHRDIGLIVGIDGVVDFDSEAERTGTYSLVGQDVPPPKKHRRRKAG